MTVIDHGSGIPQKEIEKLFKPFQKSSVKKTSGEKSTGLGLAISRKIIEEHHGKIWVESSIGKGSKFHFSVPATWKAGG